MTDTLIRRVTTIIAHEQKIPAESITIDKTFQDLKIDSYDSINIIFALEKEFDLEIPDEAMRRIHSVRDVVEGIERLVAVKATGASPA